MLKDNQLAGNMQFDLHFTTDGAKGITPRGRNFLKTYSLLPPTLYLLAIADGLAISFQTDAVRDLITA